MATTEEYTPAASRNRARERRKVRIDWFQPALILALGIIGVFFIYSAQAYTGGELWKRQAFWLVVGGIVYAIVAMTPPRMFLEYAFWIYLANVLLLLVVLSPLGVRRFDAQRWIDFQFFLFQPSETAKIGVLLMVAALLSRTRLGEVRDSWLTLVWIAGFSGFPWVLIFLQPDLGSSLVIPAMVLALLYVSRLSLRFFAAAAVMMMIGLAVITWDIWRYYDYFTENNLSFQEDRGAYEPHALLPIHDYQRNRLLSLVAPRAVDPAGVGVSWNLRQSLISVGSGGFWGKGWTEGTQARLGYLPSAVAHNDFIFSVIAEETGLVGSLGVLLLYALLIGNGLRVAALTDDRFLRLVGVGVSSLFAVHVIINIGMTIGLMPITGLPLPFLSYGGSFFLSCCILQGFLQGVYRHKAKTAS